MRTVLITSTLCVVFAWQAAGSAPGLTVSTLANPVWQIIRSAKPLYEDRCITDVVGENQPNIRFAIRAVEKGNHHQHWMVVEHSGAGGDGRVALINRATGNAIMTSSLLSGDYRYTQATGNPEESNGWYVSHLGEGQYEIYGEEDGLMRYLNASSQDDDRPDRHKAGHSLNTGFAWIFADTVIPNATGIDDGHSAGMDKAASVRIYAAHGRIVVEGCSEYTVRNMQGNAVAADAVLPVGIYFVTARGKTTKVLVK